MTNATIPAGYKQTEVGIIPEDWDVKTGFEVFTRIQDGTHFSPKLGGNDFLYVTSKNIKFGALYLESAEYISKNEHQKIYKRCDVKKGDILLTKDGANTGNAAKNSLTEECSLLSSVAFLRVDESINNADFYLQQILSSFFQQQIKDAMSGNAITRLTLLKIRNLKFFSPRLKEQTAIATALSDVDALIASLNAQIAKKRDIKTATMQQLLTGKQRLTGFGEGKGMKPSELGEIPEDWEVVPLKRITESESSISYGIVQTGKRVNDGVKCIRVIDLVNGQVSFEELITTSVSISNAYSRTILKVGDLVCALRGKIGALALIDERLSGSNLTRGVAIIPLNSNQNGEFYKQYLSSKESKSRLENSLNGSALKELTIDNLRCFQIASLTKEEQAAIARVLSAMDADIAALEQRRTKTRDIKQGMMQELLTGRTRLV